jgi:SAM-dependent methyltransferase
MVGYSLKPTKVQKVEATGGNVQLTVNQGDFMEDMQEINVGAIVQQIRENIRKQEKTDLLAAIHHSSDGLVAADLSALQSNHDIYHIQFTSHRKFLGPLVVFVKKVARQLLTPSLERQSEYNTINNRLTLRLWQQAESMQKIAQELVEQLRGVRQELAEQLGGVHQEQSAALQALRRELVEQLGGVHQRQVTGMQALRRELTMQVGSIHQEQGAVLQTLRREWAEQLAAARQEQGVVSQRLLGQLVEHMTAFHHEPAAALQGLRERAARTERRLQRFLDSMPERQGADSQDVDNSTPTPPLTLPHASEYGLDYVGFEERCRGSEEHIKQHRRVYVNSFKGSNDILDIGCGRGEFLELLGEAGIKAKGVDLDLDMVLYCQEKGLDVVNADALAYLDSLPDESLGGIFAAQVIEHLEAGRITELMKLCQQKLQPGGTLIFETPNPTCLTVFSSSIYMNLSPTQPLHPETVKFLFESAGFQHIEVHFSSPVESHLRIPSLPVVGADAKVVEEFNKGIERLNDLLYGFQDYAVIGRKSSH